MCLRKLHCPLIYARDFKVVTLKSKLLIWIFSLFFSDIVPGLGFLKNRFGAIFVKFISLFHFLISLHYGIFNKCWTKIRFKFVFGKIEIVHQIPGFKKRHLKTSLWVFKTQGSYIENGVKIEVENVIEKVIESALKNVVEYATRRFSGQK